MKRPIDCLVLSDIHLGTDECQAGALAAYLKTISPACVVLNGDIVDLLEIRRGVWPDSHHQVVRRLLKFAQKGIPVHWLAGNHDEALRDLLPLHLGDLHIADRLILELGGRRTLFIHGDGLERTTSPLLRMLGTWLYDGIQATARSWNRWMAALGRRPLAAGPLLAHHAPFAREHLLRFEQEAVHLARREGVDAIAVGHIHVPACRVWTDQGRQITYLNSGDWVDSLSALEFAHGEWRIHRVEPEPLSGIDPLYDTVEVAPAG